MTSTVSAQAGDLHDEIVAERRDGLAKSWRNVTVLLEAFGHQTLSAEARRDLHTQLDRVGLSTLPSLLDDDCDRSTKVRLLLPEDRLTGSQDLIGQRLVTASLWQPSKPPQPVPVDSTLDSALSSDDGIVWIEVEPAAEADAVIALLTPLLPGLDPAGVADLLQVDDLPEAAAYEHDNRKVSTVAVHALELDRPDGDGKAGALVFETVELLVGDRWIVSCWHEPRGTASRAADVDAQGWRTEAMAAVAECWARQEHHGVGTLGLLVFRELARSYVVARRTLYSWLEQWELQFHRHGAHVEQETLADLRYLVSEFQRRLNSLNESRAVVAEHTWFPDSDNSPLEIQLDGLLDRSIEGLISLSGMVRSAVDLLTTAGIREQLQLAHTSAQKTEKLQDQVGLVAAVLLVPTFIAGLFGANTEVPGQGHWSGFVGMLALMVVGSGGTYAFLQRAKRRTRLDPDDST